MARPLAQVKRAGRRGLGPTASIAEVSLLVLSLRKKKLQEVEKHVPAQRLRTLFRGGNGGITQPVFVLTIPKRSQYHYFAAGRKEQVLLFFLHCTNPQGE
jgi:hypothetical protein